MHYFTVEEIQKGKKFAAFFDDGSGACLFIRLDDGSYVEADGELCALDHDFIAAGYLTFIYLPDDFVLFFEQNQ